MAIKSIRAEEFDVRGKKKREVIIELNHLGDKMYVHIEAVNGEGHVKRMIFDSVKLFDIVEEMQREAKEDA